MNETFKYSGLLSSALDRKTETQQNRKKKCSELQQYANENISVEEVVCFSLPRLYIDNQS